jgi:hypothetical protein
MSKLEFKSLTLCICVYDKHKLKIDECLIHSNDIKILLTTINYPKQNGRKLVIKHEINSNPINYTTLHLQCIWCQSVV